MSYFQDWLDKVTVDPVTGESIAAKKRRKKYNIPGPGDYAYYSGAPQPKGVPLWDVGQKPPKNVGQKPPKMPEAQVSSFVSTGAQIAKGAMAVAGGPSLSMTLEELQTRNINLAYFARTGSLAPPDAVVSLLQNPGTKDLTYEGYLALFKGAARFNAQFQHERDLERWNNPDNHPTLQNLHPDVNVNLFQNPVGEEEENVMRRGMALPPGQAPDQGNERILASTHIVPYEKSVEDMQSFVKMMKRRPETTDDLALQGDAEGKALLRVVTERLKRRGARIEYDPTDPYGDPDALMAVGMYAMGQSWAYAVYGQDQDQANARRVFEYMREKPFSREAWEDMGSKLGVPMPDWHNGKTIEGVFDALRATENETSRGILFDSWMFGRPVGQSASAARATFAMKFGPDRLPASERAIYDEETMTPLKIAGMIMGAPGKMMNFAEKNKWLHPIAAPIGWAAHQGVTALMLPLIGIGDGLSTAYDISTSMLPSLDEAGVDSVDEYVRMVKAGLLETPGRGEQWAFWNYHWGNFIDGSRWIEGLQENWGQNPLKDMAQKLAVDEYGYTPQWASDSGDAAWLGVQFFLGAKLDAMGRPVASATGDLAFRGGHALEQSYRVRKYGTASERVGPDVLRYVDIEPAELERLPAADRAKAESLITRIDDLEQKHPQLSSQGFLEVPATAYDDAAIMARIDELGGIKSSTSPYWDKSLSLSENQSAHRHLARKNGLPMDDLAQNIIGPEFPGSGIVDQDSLWAFLQRQPAQKAKATGKGAVSALEKATEEHRLLYGQLDDILSGRNLAPASLVEEGVAGQNAIAFEGERITGDTQLGMGAIDQGGPGPTPKAKLPEEMPGQVDLTAEDAAFLEKTASKNEAGVEVAKVETPAGPVAVDVGAGDFPSYVQRLNDGEFPTYGSHAGGAGHPKGHPAKGVEPYIEFKLVDLGPQNVRAGKVGAIVRAAKQTGMALDKKSKTADGRTLYTVSGENIGEFIDALVPRPRPAPPRTLEEWLTQVEKATEGKLDAEQVERYAILAATNARYAGEATDVFVGQRLAGAMKGTGKGSASVQFIADGRALIRALKSSGPKEMTHELGHIFRRTLNAKDNAVAREWAGLREGETWTVAAEEKFAKAFGEYFSEYVEKGTLKAVEYKPLMRTFTNWLVTLWENIRGRATARHATPEANALFDRYQTLLRETEGALPEPRVPTVPPVFTGGPPVPEYMSRMYNVLFRNNAEVMAKVDDPSWIAEMYEVPDTNAGARDLVRKIAAETDPDKVEPLLAKLRDEHGIEIDGGASAMIKNLRQHAYRTGFGKKNMLRFFITPSLYGKTHPVSAKTGASYNYMVATKMGLSKMTDESWAKVREYRERIWEEDNPNKAQRIIQELDDEIEANIIARDGSLEPLQKYTRLYHRMQGRAIMTGGKVAYHGVGTAQAGAEGSFVTSPGKARATAYNRLEEAKAELAKHVDDLGAKVVGEFEEVSGGDFVSKPKRITKAERDRLQDAVTKAEAETYRVADAIDVVESLADVEWLSLSKAQRKALNSAHDVLNDYTVPVPVKMGQLRGSIQFRHNPRILASYMAGPASRGAALADQAVFQPLMTIFKETVMASLGFPIRVNIGDEYIRLISEGTLGRMRGKMGLRPLNKLEKNLGIDMTEIRAELHDKMAYDWTASESGSWVLVFKGTHPRYYEYLAQDLKSWANEPIVQRLVERNGGTFPEKPGDIKAFIEELMAEQTDLSRDIRGFLEDTYRYGNTGVDKVAFDEWAGLWQDRMEAISRNVELRQAMTSKVADIEALKRVPDEYLWPVNAPEAAFVGANSNPLNMLVKANPFHYVYNGVRVPFTESRRAGSVQLLGAMSNWMREVVFSDRYYMERDAELLRSPKLARTPEGLEELHQLAAERAMRYANKVTYSRSSTMFEDMTRNLIPFGNAYRQFWQYWGATFFKHPLAITTYTQGYRKFMPDQFLNIGDYQVFVPGVPFFAATDENAGTGLGGIIKSNLPQASFLVTGGARTLIGALGGDPEDYGDVAMMAGLSGRMAPFSRQARLMYGITGWADYDQMPMIGDTLVTLFGDPDRLRKASINAMLGQLHYTEGELHRDKPWWWSFGLQLGAHPEAMFAEVMKQMPNPTTVSYSPAEVAEKNDWLFKYYDATTKGNNATAAKLREDNPWLDRYLAYYDASAEEQVALKLDPKNKDMLKFWVSPYNYDTKGASFDGYDWQQQFTNGKVSWKSESELEAAIHNLYVDVHGGTYVETQWRSGGVRYAGDAPRAEARKRTIAKITRALKWADKTAKYMKRTQGWDYDRLMYMFENPNEDWGIWPSLLAANKMNPVDYNVYAVANVFFDKYADQAYPESQGALEAVKAAKWGRLKPKVLATADALRALDLAKWIPDPELAKKFLSETPYVDQLNQVKTAQRDAIFKAVIDSAGSKQWYFIGSQTLNTVGIPASPKLDAIQMELNRQYNEAKALGSGTSEYKAAMVAYWANRDKVLKGVKGGAVIAGGVADRLIAIPFVLTPKVTSMGTGATAVAKQATYDAFMRTVKRELSKDAPETRRIDEAWQKVDWESYEGAQKTELMRVAAWSFLLAEAKWRRNDMRTTYSEYYNAPMNSVASKYGQQHVKALNTTVARLRRFSPDFSRELDAWFDSDTNFGYRFLDWYTY
jgi:hypothetical protein